MAGMYSTEDLEWQVFSDGLETKEDFPASEFLEDFPALENLEDFPVMEFTLALEDGRELTCEAVGIFGNDAAQYIALHPKEDQEGLIHILKMVQGDEDELLLLPVEDDKERMEAESEFYRMFS